MAYSSDNETWQRRNPLVKKEIAYSKLKPKLNGRESTVIKFKH